VTARPVVLHLNGAPGVGKSTLARRWAEDHPGTLLLDPDVLRTWVSGWREDFVATGALIRPIAIAAVAAFVEQGRDVVLAQLLADPTELERFRSAAVEAGADWVEVLIEADDVRSRFAKRSVDEPHLEAVHQLVEEAGADHLVEYAERLAALADAWTATIRLRTVDGEVDAAYAELVQATGRGRGAGRLASST
jgi:predicted kinase